MSADDENSKVLFEPEADARLDEQDRLWESVGHESMLKLLDAAIGVLAATRNFVGVAEEALRQQQQRIRAGQQPAPHKTAEGATAHQRVERINLS